MGRGTFSVGMAKPVKPLKVTIKKSMYLKKPSMAKFTQREEINNHLAFFVPRHFSMAKLWKRSDSEEMIS